MNGYYAKSPVRGYRPNRCPCVIVTLLICRLLRDNNKRRLPYTAPVIQKKRSRYSPIFSIKSIVMTMLFSCYSNCHLTRFQPFWLRQGTTRILTIFLIYWCRSYFCLTTPGEVWWAYNVPGRICRALEDNIGNL